MDDYLLFRLIFWFVFVFGIAYLFLLIDMGIRISSRVNPFSSKRIVKLLKKLTIPKNNKMSRLSKKAKHPV